MWQTYVKVIHYQQRIEAYLTESFFAQSMHTKLDSPHAAYFTGKSVVLHPHEGPELRTHY